MLHGGALRIVFVQIRFHLKPRYRSNRFIHRRTRRNRLCPLYCLTFFCKTVRKSTAMRRPWLPRTAKRRRSFFCNTVPVCTQGGLGEVRFHRRGSSTPRNKLAAALLLFFCFLLLRRSAALHSLAVVRTFTSASLSVSFCSSACAWKHRRPRSIYKA